jgi:hypothetical protein
VFNSSVNDIIEYMNTDSTRASWRRNIVIRGFVIFRWFCSVFDRNRRLAKGSRPRKIILQRIEKKKGKAIPVTERGGS